MSLAESFAEKTCRVFLSAADLKEICRHRGFEPPSQNKEALAAFLAPRLLEGRGVDRALATLDERGLRLLHAIALSNEPVPLANLHWFFRIPDGPHWVWPDDRKVFDAIVAILVNRGIVLFGESDEFGRSHETRAQRAVLLLPDAHRAALPPYPAATEPLGTPVRHSDPMAFCMEALRTGLGRGGETPAKKDLPRDLASRVSLLFTVTGGRLSFGGAPMSTPAAILQRIRAEWVADPRMQSGHHRYRRPTEWVAHILEHLPAGRGCTTEALAVALAGVHIEVSKDALTEFLEDGHRAGLLGRRGDAGAAVFATIPREVQTAPHSAAPPLVVEPRGSAIRIRLDRSSIVPLAEVASVSRARIDAGVLLFEPDLRLMSRAHDRLRQLPGVVAARAASREFDAVANLVEGRRGSVFVHDGIVVIRADDLTLRTTLVHRLGDDVRSLGGPYVAVPRGLAGKAAEIVRKEGFSPRRITDGRQP